jgi:Protein of unknown function (DUF3800)
VRQNSSSDRAADGLESSRVILVYLVYLDDSGGDAKYQVMTALIVPDTDFMTIEEYLAIVIDEFVPEEQRDTFEFHASAMFHSKPPFESLSRDDALKIFEKCATIVDGAPLKISYGAVNLRVLRSGLYATARPTDIAFRLCLKGVEQMFNDLAEASKHRYQDFGILICDENQSVRNDLQKAFRANRRRLKSATHTRGELAHLHDDMYFGNSAYSVGIQLADICGFIILRHLEGKEDTEYLFKMIEPHICFGDVEPQQKAPTGIGA